MSKEIEEKITKKELIEMLNSLRIKSELSEQNKKFIHAIAETFLLMYIDDEEISNAYNLINKLTDIYVDS